MSAEEARVPLSRQWWPWYRMSLWGLLGTCFGGSLFGIIGGPAGMIIGFCIAGAVGVPIHLASFFLALTGPFVRVRFWLSVLAGALTGVFSAWQAEMASTNTLTVAAVVGGVATLLTLRWALKETSLGDRREELFPADQQFSLMGAFFLMSVVGLIVAIVASVLRSLGPIRDGLN